MNCQFNVNFEKDVPLVHLVTTTQRLHSLPIYLIPSLTDALKVKIREFCNLQTNSESIPAEKLAVKGSTPTFPDIFYEMFNQVIKNKTFDVVLQLELSNYRVIRSMVQSHEESLR